MEREYYEPPAHIGGYLQDRIGPFTISQWVGVAIGGLGFWRFTVWLQISGPTFSLFWWIQVVLVIGGLVLGGMLTTEHRGQAPIERLWYWGLFYATKGRPIMPHTYVVPEAHVDEEPRSHIQSITPSSREE